METLTGRLGPSDRALATQTRAPAPRLLRLAEARGEVRETLRRAGFEEHYGPLLTKQPVATVIEEGRRNG